MFVQMFMAAWPCIYLWLGLSPAINQRAGPILSRRVLMSEEQKVPAGPGPSVPPAGPGPSAQAAVQGPTGMAGSAGPPPQAGVPGPTAADKNVLPPDERDFSSWKWEMRMVPLDQFVFKKNCHREDVQLTKPYLQSLMDSIAMQGLTDAVEAYIDRDTELVLLCGHRRITSMRLLAEEGHPGFQHNMLVQAKIYLNAPLKALLLQSVQGNANRLEYSSREKLGIVKIFFDNKISVKAAALALNVDEGTIQYQYALIEHPWLFDLVLQDSIPATSALILVDTAKKENCLPFLKDQLEGWVGFVQKAIESKDRIRQAKGLPALRPSERQVKKFLSKPLVDRWVEQLRKKEPFDVEYHVEVSVGIDPDINVLRIGSQKVDLAKTPLDALAKLVGKLGRVTMTPSSISKPAMPSRHPRVLKTSCAR